MNPLHLNDPNISDAEICANWSIDAVRAGRTELAEALLRIAAQAVRTPRAPQVVPVVGVPYIGQTHDESPRPAPKLRVATYGPAETAVMQAPNTLDRRCVFEVVKGNHYQPCHGAVYWIPGTVGDAGTPATQARWEHVDDELNTDHQAFVEG